MSCLGYCVGTTPLLWFVNRGSGGDLRETHGSRDVPISPDGVGSRKGYSRRGNEVSDVARSDDRSHDALTSHM